MDAGDKLKPCPNSPNCVSTLATDRKHGMTPLIFGGDAQGAKKQLIQIIHSFPRTQIISDEGPYLHVTFTSRLFRFVDDVEFFINELEKKIHFRSASRIGYSDLGANRKRMEQIRRRFIEVQV
jgi:uncharacterized protein (DUF1499 family)